MESRLNPHVGRKLGWAVCLFLFSLLLMRVSYAADLNSQGPALQSIQFLPTTANGFQLLTQFDFSDSLSGQPTVFMMTNPARLIVDFNGVRNSLAQSALDVNQSLITSYTAIEAAGRTRIMFDLTQTVKYQMSANGAVANLYLAPQGGVVLTGAAIPANAQPSVNVNPISQGPIAIANPGIPGSAPVLYTGKRISLNFQDIKVRAVLQLLAEFTGLNIVVSDSVQGNMTLHLENVPWDQALDIILRGQGLDKRQYGNVLLIAPSTEISAREKQDLQAVQQLQDLAPLKSELIQINYGKAEDIAALLEGNTNSGSTRGGTNATTALLSARGSVSFDARTNTIWVQDTPQKIVEITKLVRQLDVAVKQVEIDARIVNVDSNYLEQLGVRFGVTQTNLGTGTLEGGTALNAGTAANAVPINQRLNIDLPSAAGVGTAGGAASVGLALAHLGEGTLLDLELSALESEGAGQVISNPRLVTADQQAAVIESGQEIPFQQQTSSGATNVAFEKAVLSLSVTPQITPDGKIILTLDVNQDRADFTQTVLGTPVINTRHISTQVLVNNGETIVLGGIYEGTNTNSVTRVPFLGTLPVVGNLFRQTNVTNKRTELLIFITPKVAQQAIRLR